MLINHKEIFNLAWSDSIFFDKEGLLLVKDYKKINEINYVQRFCRLKGNLFFILRLPNFNSKFFHQLYDKENHIDNKINNDIKKNNFEKISNKQKIQLLTNFFKNNSTNSDINKYFSFCIILQEIGLRSSEYNNREFIIDVHDKSIESDQPKLWKFFCLDINERNDWINCLSKNNFVTLKSIFNLLNDRKTELLNKLNNNKNIIEKSSDKLILKEDDFLIKNKDGLKLNENTRSNNSSHKLFSFFLQVDLNEYFYDNFSPNLFIKVYYSINQGNNWLFLGRTETINSNQTKFAKKFILNFFKEQKLSKEPNKIKDFFSKDFLLKFYVYDLIEPFTQRYILLGTAIEKLKFNFNIIVYSSINSQKIEIGKIKMSSLDNEINFLNSLDNDDFFINDEEDVQNTKPKTIENSQTNIDFFTNSVYRSFQFEIPNLENGYKTIFDINEIMSEPYLTFFLPQNLMNIFMDDEKKMMNCITYSLGEVKPEYQRKQMQMLESHLRLVNLITESINNLNQYQFSTKFFRQSIQRNEVFLQFVPLNLHLQRTLLNKKISRNQRIELSDDFFALNVYTHGAFASHLLGFENGGLSKFMYELKNSNKENSLNLNKVCNSMRNYFKILSLYNKVKELNEKMIRLIKKLDMSLKINIEKNDPKELCEKIQNLQLKNKINEEKNDNFIIKFRDKMFRQKIILTTFRQIEEYCLSMTNILDPKEVDNSLSYLEIIRNTNQYQNTSINVNKIKKSTNLEIKKESSMERTISCPIDQIQSSKTMYQKTENDLKQLRRHNSDNRIEELEFEPIDLIHLNIKASLISLQSKLNQLVNINLESYNKLNTMIENDSTSSSLNEKILNEMAPSNKKLFNSIESLLKTSSICYALDSLSLNKEQLEYFYVLRLRRNMVFSQIITSVVIALLGELNCSSSFNNLNYSNHKNSKNFFLNKLFVEKKLVCFFEGLLSCHLNEMGMLQDMEWALKELNSCVQILFVNIHNNVNQLKRYRSNFVFENENFLSDKIYSLPKFEGNGYDLQIIFPFNDKSLPDEFKCDIIGLFFNIGINDKATIAETLGHVKIQDEINKRSFFELEKYVYTQANIENISLLNNLAALKAELFSNRAKNVRILYLSELIAYELGAIRFTNCKSGKDRTAMAVTLEQVRCCGSFLNFDELSQSKLFQQMLDTLRSEGTRRENTIKNIGVAKYAFNFLRVMTLPKFYRPPQGTYGKFTT